MDNLFQTDLGRRNRRGASIVAGLLALGLVACETTAPAPVERAGAQAAKPVAPAIAPEPAKTPPPALTTAAIAALERARALANEARAKHALWPAAAQALAEAGRAAALLDSQGVEKHAKLASELAQLGLAQLSYPPVTP